MEAAGLRILERGWRCRLGEIDLVAEDGETLVFIEVKARSSGAFGPAEAAVTPAKRARLARLALAYAAGHGVGDRPMRFDVVALQGGQVRHHRAAFETSGWTR